MGAREDFFEFLETVEWMANKDYILDSWVKGNARQIILRAGLIVTVFNSMEIFFKDRLSEIFWELSKKWIEFRDFWEPQQKKLVTKSLEGIKNYLLWNARTDAEKIKSGTDLAEIIGNLSRVATPITIPETFFWFGSSNISADECQDLFKVLGTDARFTEELGELGKREFSGMEFANTFDSFKKLRNRTAHDWKWWTPISITNLEESLHYSRFLAHSFDIRATHWCNTMIEKKTPVTPGFNSGTLNMEVFSLNSDWNWQDSTWTSILRNNPATIARTNICGNYLVIKNSRGPIFWR